MNKLLTMTFAVALLMAITVPAADPNQRTVFVTSANFSSNLGGLTGADAKCQAEADGPASIVPAGTYWAWLSDGTDSPNTRFTKSSHPYKLPDGTKIAEDFTDLTDGSILHAINIDPTGQPIGYQQYWRAQTPMAQPSHILLHATAGRRPCPVFVQWLGVLFKHQPCGPLTVLREAAVGRPVD